VSETVRAGCCGNIPDDVCPNATDPANTASNGPAVLTPETLKSYRGECGITRSRTAVPAPYDLVILSSFGGPEGQEDVIPFLRNVTAGRGIPDERLEEVATHYRANGGISPINEQNRALLVALREVMQERGPHIPIVWANRNWKPYVTDVVQQAYEEGHRNILVLATSAYPGYSSCRQYREDYGVALEKLGLQDRMRIDKIRQFFDAPGFVEAFTEGLENGLKQVRNTVAERIADGTAAAGNGRIRIMFCTHSVPTSAANEAGPRGIDYEGGSAYVEKHLQVARAILAKIREQDESLLDNVDWELVYQSRSGSPSTPWLEPDVNDAIDKIAGDVDGIIMVPLGFVSDHMEVLWDLGIVAVRTPTPGVHPAYVESLRRLIAERMAEPAESDHDRRESVFGESISGELGWFDECDPDCCKPLRGQEKPVIAEYTPKEDCACCNERV